MNQEPKRESSIVVPIAQTHTLPDDERRAIGLEAQQRLPLMDA